MRIAKLASVDKSSGDEVRQQKARHTWRDAVADEEATDRTAVFDDFVHSLLTLEE